MPHEGIVRVDAISTKLIGEQNIVQVVEESYEDWHSLKSIWNKEGNEISERAVGSLAFQILHAIRHIHALNIVHGSIDMDHIICNQRNLARPWNCKFKLINFENSRIIDFPIGIKCLPMSSPNDLRSPFVSPEFAAEDLK